MDISPNPATFLSRRATKAPLYDARLMAVIKTIDLVGVSTESWRDAAEQALAEAARTIRGISGMEVLETSCTVADGKISEYLTHVRIKFRIER
jgi:dodecin